MAAFDNNELLDDIRGRGSLSAADLRFTPAKLLAAATIELRDTIVPLMVKSQTDRCVYLSDMAVTPGTGTYRLPSRAVAGRWTSVAWKDPGATTYDRLRQLSPEDYYRQSDTAQNKPYGFFVRDYMLQLVPIPSGAGTLRVPYYMRPNTLCGVAEAATVLTAAGSTVTVSSVPNGFVSGAQYDVVRGSPGFETLVVGVSATLSGSTLTFSSALPTGTFAPAAGDYVALAGYSPVAQCPVELRGLLATRSARRALMSVNEAQQASMLDSSVEELTITALDVLAPRVDAEPQEWGDIRRGLLFGLI
jgi:hypothetical protein